MKPHQLSQHPSGEKAMLQYLQDQPSWKEEIITTTRPPQALISLPVPDKEPTTKKHFVSNFSTADLYSCNLWRLQELRVFKILGILRLQGLSPFFSMYLPAFLTGETPACFILKGEIVTDREVWSVHASTDWEFTQGKHLGEKKKSPD